MYFFRVSKSPKLSIFLGLGLSSTFGPPRHMLMVPPGICTTIGCQSTRSVLSVQPLVVTSICTATAYQSARSVPSVQPLLISQPVQFYIYSHWLSISPFSTICTAIGYQLACRVLSVQGMAASIFFEELDRYPDFHWTLNIISSLKQKICSHFWSQFTSSVQNRFLWRSLLFFLLTKNLIL